jgi:hypothetical protein
MAIQLGDKARDTITGFTGTVVAMTKWIYGCERVTLQPPVDKDGKVPQNENFDIQALEIIESKPAPSRATGGPQNDRAALRR